MMLILDLADVLSTLMAIDALRIGVAILIGVLIVLPIRWRHKFVLSPVFSVLLFHLLNLEIRFYFCPLDPPLFCQYSCEGDWYQPLRMAELLGLPNGYIIFWLIVFLVVLIFGSTGLYLLYRIFRVTSKRWTEL